MKITVDRERCVASGQCVLAAAALFDQDESEGVVILLNDEPSPDLYDAARLAAQMCPSSAIEVTEEKS